MKTVGSLVEANENQLVTVNAVTNKRSDICLPFTI